MTAVETPIVELAHRITVNAREAARLFGVSQSTFRTWVATPGFPTWTPPGRTTPLFPVDAMRRWVAERATEVAA